MRFSEILSRCSPSTSGKPNSDVLPKSFAIKIFAQASRPQDFAGAQSRNVLALKILEKKGGGGRGTH